MKAIPERLEDIHISASYVNHVPDLISDTDYQAILKNAGINYNDLTKRGATINGQQFLTLIEQAEKQYGGDYPWSLLTAKHFNISTHGIFGLAIMTSTTLGEAIELGLKYAHLAMPAIAFSIEADNDLTITLSPTVDLGAAQNTLTEISMAALKGFMEQSSKDTPIISVEFQHAGNVSAQPYVDYFSCPVLFSQPKNKLCISSIDLNSPMASGNLLTANLLKHQLDEQNNSGMNTKPWTYKIETYFKQNSHRIAELSKQEVAEYLCITTRTLSRKLSIEGSSFQDILDTHILNHAIKLLAIHDLSIDQITMKLGFNSANSFSRFFKRLKNISPTDYRKLYNV